MTFSYNLVLALFLLAPGFAFVAGIYATGRAAIHEASPPPPNSIMALAMVTGGSLVAHTVAAVIFLLCHVLNMWTRWHWPTLDPNPYYQARHLAAADGLATSASFAWILSLLTLLCLGTYLATRAVMNSPIGRSELIGGALYGWFWQIEKTQGAYAYVLTQFENDHGTVGYQGLLEYVTLDAEKQISSLVLTRAEPFSLTVLEDRHIQRTPTPRTDKKLRVLLTKAEIKNIVYTPLVFEDDQGVEADDSDPIVVLGGD
ncbi:hypothetical protein [Caulobacter sp.]|uniref:hypothetical protein n=1 Tax=Caulobacter sp. TaxID=78 RepID=UPI001B100F99|nr:hypothetical protein [Caulobacter sp.]MBO9544360.1 hypothetical protein [Caulobacter sp.]